MEREIGQLSDHCIICGAGRVGRCAARELSRKPAPFVIVHQNEPKLARYGDAPQQHRRRHLLAGADEVVSRYSSVSRRIAQSLLQPHGLGFFDFATTHWGMDLEIGEIAAGAASSVAGKTIEGSRVREDSGVSILAIKCSQGMRFPWSEDRIDPGDFLIAMGRPARFLCLEQMASPS